MAVLSAAPAAAAPTASFTVSPGTTVLVGTTVTFNSTSQPDPDPAAGPITGFAWTFGEGAGASTETATHTFNTPGTFPVTLTVTDSLGTASASTTITVNPRPPTVSFTATPRVALINQPISFNPAPVAGTGAITGASWNFGNGTLAVQGPPVPVTRAYSATGNYTVGLTVTDSRGLTATATRPIRIHAAPTAAFDAFPNDPTVGQEVILSSYSSDDRAVESQNWDLDGDGAFDDASGQRVLGTFTTPGPHTVALRVRDDDGATAIATRVLNVKSSNWLTPITSGGDVKKSSPPPANITDEPFVRMLAPFPIVRLAGWRKETGARIEILGVRAPAGSKVLVRCRGKKCPVKEARKPISRKKPKPVRLPSFEQFFPAGSVIEVFVRRSDRLGKYTRFTIRSQRKRWKRIDGCVPPDTTRAVTCPAD